MDKSQYLKPREYEMLAILLPDQGEEETAAGIENVLSHITTQNGTIDSVNADSPWGRRRLAYTIRHAGVDYRDGHYVLVYFTALPSAISEIERDMKLDTNVIRYLLLINDPEMGEKFDESELAAAEEAAAKGTTEEATTAEAEVTEETPAEAEQSEEAATEEAPSATEEAAAETEEVVAEETAAEEEAPVEAEEPVAEEAPAEEAADAEQTEESDKE